MSSRSSKPVRTSKAALRAARAAAVTKPPLPKPGLRASSRPLQEKLTLSRSERADYKELKAKQSIYEKQVRVYGKLEQRAIARGNGEDQRFFSLMRHAAESQLNVLATYNRKAVLYASQRAALRAEADAKKAAQMSGGKAPKPTAPDGSAIAWARENPDEVGRHGDLGQRNAGTDEGLNRLAAERGYTVAPWTATRSQVDRMLNDYGAHEFWRGFSSRTLEGTQEEATARAKGYAQAFLKGTYRAGTGVYGSGYYVAYGDNARSISHEYAGAMLAPYAGGVVLRGAILSGARIGNPDQLAKDMASEGKSFLKSAGAKQPSDLSAADRGQYHLLFGDIGRFATYKGYDVIGGPGNRYWIILNRGVVVAQRALAENRLKPPGLQTWG